ncbi:hypothetical protein D9M71_380870 [compost metagenome]
MAIQCVDCFLKTILVVHENTLAKAHGSSDGVDTDTAPRMGWLHASFCVVLVVNYDNTEVVRAMARDCSQRTKAHHHFAVADKYNDTFGRLSQSDSHAEHHSATHCPPQVKILGAVACSSNVKSGVAETGDS